MIKKCVVVLVASQTCNYADTNLPTVDSPFNLNLYKKSIQSTAGPVSSD